MGKRKFLIFLILGLMAAVLCWPTAKAAAQQNFYSLERQAAREAFKQKVDERAKSDPLFKKYMDIYNARNQALSLGSTNPAPQKTDRKGGNQ
jgi:hypothetical protein